jgi:hypothetical protein
MEKARGRAKSTGPHFRVLLPTDIRPSVSQELPEFYVVWGATKIKLLVSCDRKKCPLSAAAGIFWLVRFSGGLFGRKGSQEIAIV